MKKVIIVLAVASILASCANYKDVPYFQNVADYDGARGAMLYDMTIKPKDMLTIFVFSGTDPNAVSVFNPRDPVPIDISERRGGGVRLHRTEGGMIHHYLVGNDGMIDFPVVGKILLGGLTVEQANKFISQKIQKYLAKDADCVVNTLIENYEVSVLGEVKNPNTFTISRNKCTVLEALAMAGDMTIYGKRDNVKLLREKEDGEYEIHELDLRDANLLNSPYYYLQQRDILYVEPNTAMVQNAGIGQTRQLWIRGASVTIALGSLLYRVLE